ncbi:hypothetical protein [Catenuloplanes japonicus]|uniref:hypothetical protein n=1 Tax=Catenuloplanes japonicus TaxID=33876 RepID=UPI000525D73C|nr:hypothetical protein [Catenuloplanes japonicus]
MNTPPIAVTLPGRHGTLDVSIAIRPAGEVAFRITGARIAGTVVFRPCPLPGQAIPDAVVVRFGDGTAMLADQLADRPVLDGHRLIGGVVTTLDHIGWLAAIDATHRRDGLLTPVPRRSVPHLHAVLTALADHYQAMDPARLALAAAHATASTRLNRLVHEQVLPTARLAADTAGELAELHDLAARLQDLSPLRLAESSAPCARRWPRVHPDTLITAGDDGDWLTCHSCGQGTVMLAAGDSLGGLLAAHAAHSCP